MSGQKERSSVICLGDSNTYGYDPRGYFGGRYDKPWPELLAERSGLQAVNKGCNGRMIPKEEAGWSCIHKGDKLIIMLGTNDLLNGASAEETTLRMNNFLEQFLQHFKSKDILLIAPPPMKRGAWVPDDKLVSESVELGRRYQQLAEEKGILFANAGAWEIDIAFDGVHFSEEGHRRFADEVERVIHDENFGCAL